MKIDHHRGPVVYVAISSTSEVLVSGSHDATICLWSLETYELLNLMQFNSPVLNFRLSPDSVSITKQTNTDFICFPFELFNGMLLPFAGFLACSL
jgi:WD40 repeat protein